MWSLIVPVFCYIQLLFIPLVYSAGHVRGHTKGAEVARIEAQEAFVDAIVAEVTMCESTNRHLNTWSAEDAYGIAQFKRKTFVWMRRLAKRPELEWKNKEDQLWLLKWAVKNGHGQHWTCYGRATAKATRRLSVRT